MITKEETDWREIFQIQELEKPFHIETEASECNANCLDAKELECVCKCGGKNHGAHLKACIKPLDTYIEKLCEHCKGEGCSFCNQTGAVEVQVTTREFYQGGD
jgi:hypothetical protein